MNSTAFNTFIKKTLADIEKLLCKKGDEYALTDDRFKNFTTGAALLGESKEKVLLGYLTKHLISVVDIIQQDREWDKLPEKTHDIIAYMLLLEAMASENERVKIIEK